MARIQTNAGPNAADVDAFISSVSEATKNRRIVMAIFASDQKFSNDGRLLIKATNHSSNVNYFIREFDDLNRTPTSKSV